MFTKVFWADAFERVLFTMAEVLLALWTVDGFDLLNTNWKAQASVVVTAGVVAILKTIIAAKATDASISPASFATDNRGF